MKSLAAPLIKLIVFALVTIAATGTLATTIASAGTVGGNTFSALFDDVTSLNTGDDVRIAGVRVGQVTGISVHDRAKAKVDFTVNDRNWLPASTIVNVRFRNLVGQRYLALEQGAGRQGEKIAPGAVIPLEQTRPAVDLTVLFNGFKPLFTTLSADDVNKLSLQIIQVFQGEAGTIEELVRTTGELTSTLAQKDAVIGSVITNLGTTLNSVAVRDEQLDALLVNTAALVKGLAEDRTSVGEAVTALGGLTLATANLLEPTRSAITDSITALPTLTDTINARSDDVNATLAAMPRKLEALVRTASYGSWFQFYLCGIDIQAGPGSFPRLNLPTGLPVINQPIYTNAAKRCTQEGMSQLQAENAALREAGLTGVR